MYPKAMQGTAQCRVEGKLYKVTFIYISMEDMRRAAICTDTVKFAAAMRRHNLNQIPASVASYEEVNEDPR